jgi:hypothetical protein
LFYVFAGPNITSVTPNIDAQEDIIGVTSSFYHYNPDTLTLLLVAYFASPTSVGNLKHYTPLEIEILEKMEI